MKPDDAPQRTSPGSGRGRRRLRGCALILGVLLLLPALALAIFWGLCMGLSNRAVATREALEAAHPSQTEFIPHPEGILPEDRLWLFIRVRRELHPFCERFGAFQQSFRTMEKETERLEGMEEEPAAEEFVPILKGAGSVFRGLFLAGRDLGQYAAARNRALMENGMGLGEYTWICVLAHYSWLGHRPSAFVPGDPEGRVFYGRVLGNVREMVRRHVRALEAAPERSGDPRQALEVWRAELAAMDSDPRRIPFRDGLPSGLESSLRPFRRDLEELFCQATVELDLMQTERHGIRYEHN